MTTDQYRDPHLNDSSDSESTHTDPSEESLSAPIHLHRMTESSSTSIKVVPPEAFDGTPLKFHDWHRQVLIYIHGKKITADDDQILVTLSYMKSGTVAAWANCFFNANLDGLGTWAEFETQLKVAFEDKTLGCKA